MKNFKFYWEVPKEDDIRINVPGFLKNEITVKLSGASLKIRAEKKSVKVEKGKGFHREESFARTFSKHISLPRRIDPHEFAVSISDGEVVLKRRVHERKRIKEKS